MPRQLALRTVSKWFSALSFDAQKDALSEMQTEHDRALSAKRADLERQLADLGFGTSKRLGRPRKMDGRRGVRGGAVKAKYHDPKTGETWSGRGRMARWLKSKQDAGEKVEKYLV